MSREDRIQEVKNNYYNIDIEEYKDLLQAYSSLCMSREEAMYKITSEKLDEVTTFLRSRSLDDESEFNKAIKILSNLGKMWDSVEKARSKMLDADSKINVRGGIKESYREKRNK